MPIYKQKGTKNGLQRYRVVVSYTTADGEHKQLSQIAYGKTDASAVEASLLSQAHTPPEHRSSVADLISEYMEAKKPLVRLTSWDKSRRIIESHILPVLGKTRLDRLTVRELERWRSSVEALPMRSRSKNNVRKELSAVFNWAVKTGRMQSNPLSRIDPFTDPETNDDARKPMHVYTAEQFARYAAAAKADAEKKGDWRFYTFFMAAFYTGCRKGELNALRWSDIEGDVLHVRRSVAQKVKGPDIETAPKTAESIRDLRIPAPLKEVLDEQKRRQMTDPAFSEDFRVCGGPECLRDSTIEKRNQKYAEDAGLPHIRIHDFRHTHATILLGAMIPITEVSRRIGHSSSDITMRVYAHAFPEQELAAISVLDNLIPAEK